MACYTPQLHCFFRRDLFASWDCIKDCDCVDITSNSDNYLQGWKTNIYDLNQVIIRVRKWPSAYTFLTSLGNSPQTPITGSLGLQRSYTLETTIVLYKEFTSWKDDMDVWVEGAGVQTHKNGLSVWPFAFPNFSWSHRCHKIQKNIPCVNNMRSVSIFVFKVLG